jgi:hypothetical protein
MQKVLSFNVHPLPILVEKIKKFFVGKFVVVKYGSYENYCFGTLTDFEVCQNTIILILENDGKKMLIFNPILLKVF